MAISAITIDNDGGVSVASFREIRESLANDYRAVFGSEGENINLEPSSPDGMMIDLFAFAYSAIAEHLQVVAQGMNPATASGVFLDYLASITVGGRNDGETDEELRNRICSAEHYGYATHDGMLTYLRTKIDGGVAISANDEDAPVNGIPAHGIEVFVPESVTATDDEIAQFIWDCKPAGIKAVGASSGIATDAAGVEHEVRFSPVTGKDFLVKITITEYEEEDLPEDYAERIREAVSAWGVTEYAPGKDIIPQRISVPVFGVDGIESVNVQASTDGGETWSCSRLPVEANAFAVLPAENITVQLEN